MSIESAKIEVSEYEKLLEKKVTLAGKVQEFTRTDGFLILKAVFYNFEQDIKNKRQPTWETYNAKMEAIEIVKGLFNELDSILQDGEQAHNEIKKLIETERSTPSFLSLDGEGTEDGQQSEL